MMLLKKFHHRKALHCSTALLAFISLAVFPATNMFAQELELLFLNNETGYRIDGSEPGEHAGNSVSFIDDFNGDGIGPASMRSGRCRLNQW